MPGIGHKAFVNFGPKEGTYGTFVAPTKRLEVLSFTVDPTFGYIPDDSLTGTIARRRSYQGGFGFKAKMSVRAQYEGLEQFIRSALGGYARSTVTGTAGDHTFKEAGTVPSLCFEVQAGEVPDNTKCFRALGVKVDAFTFKLAAADGAAGMGTLDLDLLMQDYQSNQSITAQVPVTVTTLAFTAGAFTITRAAFDFGAAGVAVGQTANHPDLPPGTTVIAVAVGTVTLSAAALANGSGQSVTFTTLDIYAPFPALYHQGNTVDDGTGDTPTVRAVEVSWKNSFAYEERRRIGTSALVMEPIRNGFGMCEWKLTQEFETLSQFDAARAATAASPKLIFKHGTDIAASNTKRELEFRSNNGLVREWSAPIEGPGIIISTATIEAFYDPTDAASLVVRTRNNLPALA